MAAIHTAIQTVMEEIGSIGKEKRNTQQGFNYRGIDDVMNVLHPLLVKAHMVIWPEAIEVKRQERTTQKSDRVSTLFFTVVKMKYHFMSTEDGSEIQVIVYGEGMDSGDKSMNKAMAVAMKYACFQVFCIPTEELKDPDAESYQNINPYQAPQGYYQNQYQGGYR